MRRHQVIRLAAAAAVLLLALLPVACAQDGDPDLEIGPAQAALPVSGTSQIVLQITNDGSGDDRLLGVDTDAALGVEIHRTQIEDGRASMSELEEVEISAGETVRFRPGGLHLMMIVPDETVTLGGTFEITLRFDRSGEQTVPVEVVELLDLVDDPDPEA